MDASTLTDKLISYAIIQVVIDENQRKRSRFEGVPGCGYTRDHGDAMIRKEQVRDLLGKYCVILEKKDIHV